MCIRDREAASLLRLEPYLQRTPLQLSGGQQQRTAIARALVKGADLVPVSYTHLRAHETVLDLVCRLLLAKKKNNKKQKQKLHTLTKLITNNIN